MNSTEKIEKITEILLQEIKNIDAIVLFGSYARGKERNTSDIDVAIKPNEEIDKKQMFNIKNKLEEAIGIDVHLINLNTINDDFIYEILISGKTLYCNDQYKFEMYKLKKYSDYFLFNEDRKPIIDKIKNGGRLYGK